MAEMDARETIQLYQLHYSDLITLSSPSPSCQIQRLRSITDAVIETLGPTGPGLLAITGVPDAASLRNSLLPLASDLSLLSPDHRYRILKKSEKLQDHGLGSDVPLKNLDRCVSSYAMQLEYGHFQGSSNHFDFDKHNPVVANCATDGYTTSIDDHFKDLSGCFRKLGACMMDLGLRVARICDRAIGGTELEGSLSECGSAKGRLIHYHSYLDTRTIKEYGRRKVSKNSNFKYKQSFDKNGPMQRNDDGGNSTEKTSDLWQQWHYDYGTFTILTSPMFIQRKCSQLDNGEDGYDKFCTSECPSPSEHTYLQIFHPNKNNICIIKAPPESFILQVGESADILSRSKLRATLHSVSRPVGLENVSRETFVVFLHPGWNKVFDLSGYPMEQLDTKDQKCEERSQGQKRVLEKFTREIHEIIPPLSSRLKDGMTFAEFARETTKQYYGGTGLQSNR